jgi:hypothetical protein
MPSVALTWWQNEARKTLDNMVAVHAAVGGRGRGRKDAIQQVNNAYAVLLSSQFQKCCRDLHSQAASHIADQAPVSIRRVRGAACPIHRKSKTRYWQPKSR